jgi:tetratricopeptide (TPR) repeat protein
MKNDDMAGRALAYKAYGDIYIGMREYVTAENFYRQALAMIRLPEKKKSVLAHLDALYRMAFLNASWNDRVGRTNFSRRIVKFMDDPKIRRITARYNNMYNILYILNSFPPQGIPKGAMKRLYAQMAFASFETGDQKTADRFLDLALSYSAPAKGA